MQFGFCESLWFPTGVVAFSSTRRAMKPVHDAAMRSNRANYRHAYRFRAIRFGHGATRNSEYSASIQTCAPSRGPRLCNFVLGLMPEKTRCVLVYRNSMCTAQSCTHPHDRLGRSDGIVMPVGLPLAPSTATSIEYWGSPLISDSSIRLAAIAPAI